MSWIGKDLAVVLGLDLDPMAFINPSTTVSEINRVTEEKKTQQEIEQKLPAVISADQNVVEAAAQAALSNSVEPNSPKAASDATAFQKAISDANTTASSLPTAGNESRTKAAKTYSDQLTAKAKSAANTASKSPADRKAAVVSQVAAIRAQVANTISLQVAAGKPISIDVVPTLNLSALQAQSRPDAGNTEPSPISSADIYSRRASRAAQAIAERDKTLSSYGEFKGKLRAQQADLANKSKEYLTRVVPEDNSFWAVMKGGPSRWIEATKKVFFTKPPWEVLNRSPGDFFDKMYGDDTVDPQAFDDLYEGPEPDIIDEAEECATPEYESDAYGALFDPFADESAEEAWSWGEPDNNEGFDFSGPGGSAPTQTADSQPTLNTATGSKFISENAVSKPILQKKPIVTEPSDKMQIRDVATANKLASKNATVKAVVFPRSSAQSTVAKKPLKKTRDRTQQSHVLGVERHPVKRAFSDVLMNAILQNKHKKPATQQVMRVPSDHDVIRAPSKVIVSPPGQSSVFEGNVLAVHVWGGKRWHPVWSPTDTMYDAPARVEVRLTDGSKKLFQGNIQSTSVLGGQGTFYPADTVLGADYSGHHVSNVEDALDAAQQNEVLGAQFHIDDIDVDVAEYPVVIMTDDKLYHPDHMLYNVEPSFDMNSRWQR